jgi:SAM-dependent methyltransferase
LLKFEGYPGGLPEERWTFMCNDSGMNFVSKVVREPDVKGKRVLEVGSVNVNGSVRPVICRFGPSEYIGVDIVKGEGVDKVCSAEDLLKCFPRGSFGLVVSTEVLEHVRDWRRVITNIKSLLAEDGVLVLTTRSYGFGYHGYPYDFWRFEEQDMRELFGDMRITDLESDPSAPGVFLRAVRGKAFAERDLSGYRLYSMVKGGKAGGITDLDCALFRLRRGLLFTARRLVAMLPDTVTRYIKSVFRQ